MKKQIIIASHNESKVKEFRELFAPTPYEVVSLSDINFQEDIVENGETFQDNAILKAETIYQLTHTPVIADDSGLVVNALDGFPGVYSARFMHDHSASEKNLEIIKRLAPYSDKSAKFVAAIALVGLTPFPQVFVGEAKGTIIDELRGDNGFGYDPIFLDAASGKTFAELDGPRKNKISHRGKAMELLLNFLKNELK